MIHISPHIAQLKPSATLAINEQVQALRSQGKPIYHFGFGQSPFPIPKPIVDELHLHADRNSYLPSLGLPKLREAIGNYLKEQHQLQHQAAHIFVGPGSKELIFQTLLILQGVTLIPRGSWVSYLPQVLAKGGAYDLIDTIRENSYKLTPQQLEACCERNKGIQKTLILNSPNNPTGAVYSEDELKALAVVCRKHQVIVLSDEIYSLLNFSNHRSPSMASFYPENTMVFGGLSKIFSAGGYRLGFMALPESMESLVPAYQALFSETFSAVATPIQYAAIKAFAMSATLSAQIAKNTFILKSVAEYVSRELTEGNILYTTPEGGFYTVIDLEHYNRKLLAHGLETSMEIAHYLLNQAGVAVLPGSDFYLPDELPVFRMAFVDFDGARWSQIPSDLVSSNSDHIREYAPNIVLGIEALKSVLSNL